MKGVSSVFAILLLLLITISIVWMMNAYIHGMTNEIGRAADTQMDQLTSKISKQIMIYTINYTAVSIKNIGVARMSNSEIGIYIDGYVASCSPPMQILEPHETETCNLVPACAPGQAIKIIAPGNNIELIC